MAERHKVPFTQKRAGESWESYGDRMALQVARLTEKNRRLREALGGFEDYFDPKGGVSDVPLGPFERARALLALAEEKL